MNNRTIKLDFKMRKKTQKSNKNRMLFVYMNIYVFRVRINYSNVYTYKIYNIWLMFPGGVLLLSINQSINHQKKKKFPQNEIEKHSSIQFNVR